MVLQWYYIRDDLFFMLLIVTSGLKLSLVHKLVVDLQPFKLEIYRIKCCNKNFTIKYFYKIIIFEADIYFIVEVTNTFISKKLFNF